MTVARPRDIPRMRLITPVLLLLLAGAAPPMGSAPRPPLVIAHRGASGELPEHTLAAYERAIDQGADCIEPDLVMTRDGVLVARHDIYLSTTTDVAEHPEFAARRRPFPTPRAPDRTEWFVADFTLEELATLRARQPFPGRSTADDGRFAIPTFDAVLALARRRSAGRATPVCIYPEAKAPAFHAARGLDLGTAILAALERHGVDRPGAPLFIQSFDPAFLHAMRSRTALPLILLVEDQAALAAARALPGAPFWEGLGVPHAMLFDAKGASSGLVESAHEAGQLVHVWTYRDDAPFTEGESTEQALRQALALGVDGIFTDFPASAVRVIPREVVPALRGRGRVHPPRQLTPSRRSHIRRSPSVTWSWREGRTAGR